MIFGFETYLALVVLWVFAAERFSERGEGPRTRASTTVIRYFAGSFVYFLGHAGIFLLFVLLLRSQELLPLLSPTIEIQPVLVRHAPLLAALFVLALLPTMPFFRDLESWFRRIAYEVADLPRKLFVIREDLEKRRFEVSDGIRSRLDDRWRRPDALQGGEESEEWKRQWKMVGALLMQLRERPFDAGFQLGIERNRLELDALFERYQWLESAVSIEAELEEREVTVATEAAQDLVRFLRDDVRTLLKDTLTLIASLVLLRYRTERRRQSALSELGFVY